ncbi:hypothetical protein HOY82DRAFT_596461 [Tuber indicum]|nr:hypothetical protein HOY82DRAFT_596461 [Tuber indicum]
MSVRGLKPSRCDDTATRERPDTTFSKPSTYNSIYPPCQADEETDAQEVNPHHHEGVTLPAFGEMHATVMIHHDMVKFRNLPEQQSTHTQNIELGSPTQNEPISLEDIRHLLQFHEEEITDRIVRQLRSHNTTPCPIPLSHNSRPAITTNAPNIADPTLTRITELETQLAQLEAERQLHCQSIQPPRETGTFNPVMLHFTQANGSTSEGIDFVETLFPGVERATLAQIIENCFKPTNIYRLLGTEKERAEVQRTICIGGIEFEQAERHRKESEYRMSGFFKAWAAYRSILVKLAPYTLQGELAISFFLYTMSLYDRLEKYTWDGMNGTGSIANSLLLDALPILSYATHGVKVLADPPTFLAAHRN